MASALQHSAGEERVRRNGSAKLKGFCTRKKRKTEKNLPASVNSLPPSSQGGACRGNNLRGGGAPTGKGKKDRFRSKSPLDPSLIELGKCFGEKKKKKKKLQNRGSHAWGEDGGRGSPGRKLSVNGGNRKGRRSRGASALGNIVIKRIGP